MKRLTVIKKSDNLSIAFGEYYDNANGNPYYDANVYIGKVHYKVRGTYGSCTYDKQGIDDALKEIGYRIRACKADFYRPYRNVRTSHTDVKRFHDLNKVTGAV